MEKGLKEKTGKTLAEWKKLVQKEKLEKHGEIMKFLKGTHGLTHGFANFVALKYREADAGSHQAEDLMDMQYKGKENLKPIYDLLYQHLVQLGEDVEVAPKKASVSFRRKKQFALVQPSTKSRMDVGLKFKDKPHAGRLEPSGIFGAMCTHRVRLTGTEEVDAELIGWLREAYEEAG